MFVSDSSVLGANDLKIKRMDAFLRYGLPQMPRRYRLFISHAWDYKGDYEGLVNLLNSDPFFQWENLSAPKENPLATWFALPKSYRYLVHQIDELVSQADCLLVLAGMYVTHSGWIQSEIESAQAFRKPIISVERRGSERLPYLLTLAASETVGWASASIIGAIRRHVP